MNPTVDAVLKSWPSDPWLIAALGVTALLYLRGWFYLRRRNPLRWRPQQPLAFLAGLFSIFLAVASPIDPFANLLLQVHMVQHLLLMMAAPALFWLGEPFFPILRGLPDSIRMVWAVPLLRWLPLQRVLSFLTNPVAAWTIFVSMTWLWHTPGFYDLAFRSDWWHGLQHTCFLVSGLLFWYPVIRPYPARPAWSLWLLGPYLFLADIQNTALSALLSFSDTVLYPHYAEVPRLAGISALSDQSVAGVIMWVPGSVIYLIPLFFIGLELLLGPRNTEKTSPIRASSRFGLPLVTDRPAARIDVLRIPALGQFLKWRYSRLTLQIPMLVVALAVLIDGFRGPEPSPMNLAGVLPWIHWRGLLIGALLIAGNFFCFACPFLVPRTLARRLLPASFPWPSWLRSKWLAVALLTGFFWSYEAFSLWDSPWLTAWIASGFFLGAFVVDGVFKDAAFCKYVCPIGQFNFLMSLFSPLEIKTRDPAVCASCRTRDCIRGRDGIPGCDLHLYQPRKAGNLDCTFCLDCVHACPHDNIGLLPAVPAAEIWHDRQRSGLGRLSHRPDLAALSLVLTFGAFANAAGMVGPVLGWQDRIQSQLGLRSPLLVVTLFYLFALIVLPVVSITTATYFCRRWTGLSGPLLQTAARFSYSLLPLGFAMWLAHYSFHFFTSFDTVVPVTQRFLSDLGWSQLAEPDWQWSCCRPVAAWLIHMEIVALDAGLLLSLYSIYRTARDQATEWGAWVKAAIPWAFVSLLLFAIGIWILFQPMQMRGTMGMPG